MPTEKTLAIVLRVIDFSESSCVVTLFTRDFGKISGLAKGARRPKSAFEAALDLLAVCRIVFLHKSSEALDLLTEAKLQRRFKSARNNLSRLYAGYYVAELLTELTDEGDPHPELFDAAESALVTLDDQDHGDDSVDVVVVLMRFELTALRLLGHLPSLTQCVGCGCSVDGGSRVAFGQLSGGVLCGKCRIGKKQVVSVRTETIETLRRLAEPEDRFNRFTLDRGSIGELRGVLNHYLRNLLGHRLRMHQFLGLLAE